MKKKLLIMLLSVTATAMTFAQQSGENSPLTPVDGVTFPFTSANYRYIPYSQGEYFSNYDLDYIEHIYDSNFKEIYTINSELIDNVFYNIPCFMDLVDPRNNKYQFATSYGTFTQKLFNDDDEFEYFAVDGKVTSDGDPLLGGMILTCGGFKIMQTNGNCIAEVKLPETYSTIGTLDGNVREQVRVAFSVFVLDGNIYVVVWWNNTNYLYKYNKENAGVTLVTASSEPSQAAYPNPVKAGQPLNIRCKQGIGNAVVNITGLNGTLVKSLNATTSAGGTLSIPTDVLAGGIYLYTVLSRNRVVTSGKLVVE